MIYLNIPVNPVPASRPRVTRWGCYYGKRHSACRAELCSLLDTMRDNESLPSILCGRLTLWVLFSVKKPKTTKLDLPRGDIDNYIKLLLDACNERLWKDDVQVEVISARKEWADDVGCSHIWIKEQLHGQA